MIHGLDRAAGRLLTNGPLSRRGNAPPRTRHRKCPIRASRVPGASAGPGGANKQGTAVHRHPDRYRPRHRCGLHGGFTLVELLVVLVILGLLAGLVAPRVMSQLEGAKVDAARAQIDKLSAELDIYRLNNGSYPERLEHLLEAPPDAPNWKGPYVKSGSLTDPWGEPYRYRYPGENWDYDLYSLGADRAEGGEGSDGDITNWN